MVWIEPRGNMVSLGLGGEHKCILFILQGKVASLVKTSSILDNRIGELLLAQIWRIKVKARNTEWNHGWIFETWEMSSGGVPLKIKKRAKVSWNASFSSE